MVAKAVVTIVHFGRRMLRKNSPTFPVKYMSQDYTIHEVWGLNQEINRSAYGPLV